MVYIVKCLSLNQRTQNHTNSHSFQAFGTKRIKCSNGLTRIVLVLLGTALLQSILDIEPLFIPWEPASLNTTLVWLWPSINVPVTQFGYQPIVFVSEGRGRSVSRTTLVGQTVFHYSGSERAGPHHSSSFNGWTGWQTSTAENGHTAVGTLGTIMGLGKEGCCVCLRGVCRTTLKGQCDVQPAQICPDSSYKNQNQWQKSSKIK